MNKSVHYLIIVLTGLTLMLAGVEGQAAKKVRPGDVSMGDDWKQGRFDFVFDNHMDTHVQLKYDEEDGEPEELWGSMYVIFTDDQGVSLGNDPVSGLPIARHPRGTNPDHDETCGTSPNIVCVVGWHVEAIPGAFKFLYHSGVNGNDHAIWMVNRAEEASAPAPGMVIPQPFIPSHVHWISRGSTDSRAGSVSDACDKNNAGQLESADGKNDPSAVNEVCQGWFMELKAVKAFAFQHGGEVIPIHPGDDLRSHLNIVTNYDQTPVVDITATRTSGGH
ncbi:MAG: hypothetical protein OEM43_00970 [Gammaproteobacteria bacterium]|nr:hypothetical protein [Gammaproteobacteria bacterium]